VPTSQRMFVALTPSPEAVRDLSDFLEPRLGAGADLRWSDPAQWHLTLAFLPRVPERALDGLAERLARAAGRRAPFTAALTGGGAFPNPLQAKVLYVGVDVASDDPVLPRLADSCRAAANRAGAPTEGGRFHPHVTVARCGRPAQLLRWVRLLDTYAGPLWPVDRLTLYASHLGEGRRGRPRHEVVGDWPFGAS
jgi:RNA 2',3'-cyclic 3'-phosphodiesterase